MNQYILIRGKNKSKPILLFLHGGPGMPMMYLSHQFQRDLEDDFVVVHWDQRGAGKSYNKDVPIESMNVEQFILDTHELTQLLRERFNQEKVYLIGHSWGSYLGMIMIQRYPELFYAYVGVGQVVHEEKGKEIQEQFIRKRAIEMGNSKVIEELDAKYHCWNPPGCRPDLPPVWQGWG